MKTRLRRLGTAVTSLLSVNASVEEALSVQRDVPLVDALARIMTVLAAIDAGEGDEEVVSGPVDDGIEDDWVVRDLCDKWRSTPHIDNPNVEFTCAHVKKSCDDPEDEEE